MTQQELDNINKSFRPFGVQLSLLEDETKEAKIVPTSGEMTTDNLEIVEFGALPVSYFLRPRVREIVLEEILKDVLEGTPLPSGVNLIGMEIQENEQAKDIHGESEPVSKQTGKIRPRRGSSTSGTKPNGSSEGASANTDKKDSEINQVKEKTVGEDKQ